MIRKKQGFLAAYARHCGISHVAARKLLIRAGVDYHQPFDWPTVDRLLDAGRYLGREAYRKRKVRYPDA